MHYIETDFMATQFKAAEISKCLAFIKRLRELGVEYTHYFVD
mgnify:FL=1